MHVRMLRIRKNNVDFASRSGLKCSLCNSGDLVLSIPVLRCGAPCVTVKLQGAQIITLLQPHRQKDYRNIGVSDATITSQTNSVRCTDSK